MKIFITGGTGFIGAELVRQLAKTKHVPVCLARKTSNCSELERLGMRIVYGDVTDRRSVLDGMKGCDWAISLANVYSYWEPDRSVFRKVNVGGTRNVMECALEAGIKKIVHVSSSVTWGNVRDTPFKEDTPPGDRQFSDYALSKHEGDMIAWDLYLRRGLPLVMVYPGAVLGAGDPKTTGEIFANVIGRRMPMLALTGTMTTYVHVRDVADAIIRALEKKNNIGEKYLVGNHTLRTGELYAMISELSGVPLPRLSMPDFLTSANALLLTGIANVIKKPPLLGMSTGLVRQTRGGIVFDGSKAERELGIRYTPIRQAVKEEIDAMTEKA